MIKLSNQESIRTLGEKENYRFLVILEADTIKQVDMKEKIRKYHLRRTRKLLSQVLQQKSHQINKHLGSFPCKVLWTILKWTREELRQMDKKVDDYAQDLTSKR